MSEILAGALLGASLVALGAVLHWIITLPAHDSTPSDGLALSDVVEQLELMRQQAQESAKEARERPDRVVEAYGTRELIQTILHSNRELHERVLLCTAPFLLREQANLSLQTAKFQAEIDNINHLREQGQHFRGDPASKRAEALEFLKRRREEKLRKDPRAQAAEELGEPLSVGGSGLTEEVLDELLEEADQADPDPESGDLSLPERLPLRMALRKPSKPSQARPPRSSMGAPSGISPGPPPVEVVASAEESLGEVEGANVIPMVSEK